jgi:heptosyltransferase-2
LLLVGGEADQPQLALLRDALRDQPLLHTASDLPLPALAAILQRARLFLGHDSGISHIAAAAGAPTLLLFGPTDPDIWAPLTGQVRIIRPQGEDLTQLPLEPVAQALREALSS